MGKKLNENMLQNQRDESSFGFGIYLMYNLGSF